jgi:hypothetical protein
VPAKVTPKADASSSDESSEVHTADYTMHISLYIYTAHTAYCTLDTAHSTLHTTHFTCNTFYNAFYDTGRIFRGCLFLQ